jgi:hypothetical protein
MTTSQTKAERWVRSTGSVRLAGRRRSSFGRDIRGCVLAERRVSLLAN